MSLDLNIILYLTMNNKRKKTGKTQNVSYRKKVFLSFKNIRLLSNYYLSLLQHLM